MQVSVFSPAKINLFLAVTGRRADGFHDLVSVAAPLDFGDELKAEPRGQMTENGTPGEENRGQFTLECNRSDVPVDGSNLVLRAAAAFVAASGWTGAVHFKLTKRIPPGAGLGGGSSNAVAALRALNQLAGNPLVTAQLASLAAGLGSDCALFLHGTPVVMRGRGEQVDELPVAALDRLRGRRVLLFKPGFGIGTPWAYQRMIARGGDYIPALDAEARLTAWVEGVGTAEDLLFNNLEPAAFEKYIALPVLLSHIRRDFGVSVAMSGSGSACFALLDEGDDAILGRMKQLIRESWSEVTFLQEARLA